MRITSEEYYSNCLFEVIKAKIKDWKYIKIVHIKSEDGLHHWMWHDLKDGNIYDFQQLDVVKHYYNLLWYKGQIRIRPYKVYKRWLKTKQW